MKKVLKTFGAAVALALTIGVSSVSAAPILFCSNGGIDLAADGCISGSSNAYPGGGDGIYSNAGGGDPESAVEAAILAATGSSVDITKYGKSDDNAALFDLTGFPGQSGTWSVKDSTLISYITVKAANSFALYDVGGVSSGSWTTDGMLNNGGQQPGVSHITFWTAPLAPVPLPAAAWMLLAGVGGLAALRRRKKA